MRIIWALHAHAVHGTPLLQTSWGSAFRATLIMEYTSEILNTRSYISPEEVALRSQMPR